MATTNMVCLACGHVGRPERITKGSIWIELILWLSFFVPGLIYSIWRLTTRHDACPACKQTSLIPVDSPMGRKFIAETLGEQPPKTADPTPTRAAKPAPPRPEPAPRVSRPAAPPPPTSRPSSSTSGDAIRCVNPACERLIPPGEAVCPHCGAR